MTDTKRKPKAKPRYVIQSSMDGLFGPFWTPAAAAKWAHRSLGGHWVIRPIRPA